MTISHDFKYVIIDGIAPRIGSACESHQDLAGHHADQVTSAGFGRLSCNPDTGRFEVCCFGKSVGLGKMSQPGDDAMIVRMFEEVVA
jgi:hypothetical protein